MIQSEKDSRLVDSKGYKQNAGLGRCGPEQWAEKWRLLCLFPSGNVPI